MRSFTLIRFSALVLAASLAMASCNRDQKPLPEGASIATVQRGTLESSVEELGSVESTRIVQIMPPFSARLLTLLETGTPVKKGQEIATLDVEKVTETLDQRLDELKQVKKQLEGAIEELKMALRENALDLSGTEAQLDLARVQLADVNRNLAELEYLESRQIASADQVRDSQSNLVSTQIRALTRDLGLREKVTGSQNTQTQKELDLQRISLRGDEATDRINEAQQKIDESRILAPVDGMFLRHRSWSWRQRKTSERQPGDEVEEDELIGTIPDLNSLLVRTQISEDLMTQVKAGTPVEVSFEALGNMKLPGKVSWVAPLAIERETSAGGQISGSGDTLTGERVFEIQVTLDQTDTRLRPGLTARVRLVLSRRDDLLLIPVQAVTTRGEEHLVTVRRGQELDMVPITIGDSNQTSVEVKSGLKEGDEVILGAGAMVVAQAVR